MVKILSQSGQLLAILDKLINPIIKEQINGEYIFSFTTIIEELKSEYIHYENLIEVENNLFNIIKYTSERTNDNKLLISVLCEHISYNLIDEPLTDFNHTNLTASAMLALALQGTSFTIGTVNIANQSNVQITKETNKREVLSHISNNYHGEYVYNKYSISLLSQRGTNRGTEIRVGKNLKGIRKIVDNSIQIEGLPKTSYEIDFVELNEIEIYKGLEGISLGDTVKIIDDDLGTDILARVLEYEYDPVERRNSRVVLGNFIANYATYMSSKASLWDRATAINENLTIDTTRLEGIIDTLQNQVLAGLGTVKMTDNNGILIIDNPDETAATKALRLLGGILAISNSKNVNGNWIWRTFGTGDGFSADVINAGVINTALVTIQNAVNRVYFDATGLYVTDANNKLKLRIGQYAEGKYGLQIKNKNGTDVILDEDGIIQTDTIQEADNVDSTHPLKLKFYVDDGVISVKKVNLAFSVEKFRAYETGAKNNADVTYARTKNWDEETGASLTLATSSVTPTFPSLTVSSEGSHSHSLSIGNTSTGLDRLHLIGQIF